jgi:hypothetical protein
MAIRFRKNKHLVMVPVVIIAAIALVGVLAWKAMEPVNQKNGFTRYFAKTTQPMLYAVLEKETEIRDIAGLTDNNIYFYTNNPSQIVSTDTNLITRQRYSIKVPINNLDATLFNVVVDSPAVSILAGNSKVLIEANLNTNLVTKKKITNSIFTRSDKLSSNSYILRGFDSSIATADQIFIKVTSDSGIVQKSTLITPIKNDAGLSSDGILNFDSKTSLLVYTFFYGNQFICMDSSLSVVYIAHTIDTTNMVRASAEIVSKDKVMTNLKPKRLINTTSIVNGGLLYNASNLIADNESKIQFENNHTVDVYDIKSSKYIASFYIPKYKDEKMYSFRIRNGKLFVLYRNYIVAYRLS